MYYGCVFEVVIVWSAYLSQRGNLSSCKWRTIYRLFGTFLLFATGAFSPSSFEPSSSNSSVSVLLWPNASVCRCTGALARLKPKMKWTRVETNVPHKLTVTARTIFPPPHQPQIVSERESQGRHLDTGGGSTRKHDRQGPNGQLLCILDRQRSRRLSGTLRDHVRSASALSALKKSLVANLSAKRQLSVAKLSAKRIFSLAKRDFLVANGRMAADFSSPAIQEPLVALEPHRPPMTNVGTETAFRHDHCKHFQKSKHLLLSEVSWCDHRLASCTDLKRSILRGQSSRTGTTQVDFEVDHPPPADSPPGDFSITMVNKAVIIYKRVLEKLKKVTLVRIFHWSDGDENAIDCEIACDCVKRANVVVGLRKEFSRGHSYPQADICSPPYGDHDDIWQDRS